MNPSTNLEAQLISLMSCPLCGGSFVPTHSQTTTLIIQCQTCAATYPQQEGIWRMLTPQQHTQYQSFLTGYPLLRQREGWERDPAYFLSLPNVPSTDPTAFVWKIRRRSLATLDRLLTQHQSKTKNLKSKIHWALDLGAGNGWLSRHLTHLGYRTVALDLTVAGLDSLAGIDLYTSHDHIWIGRIQASMSRPPFRDHTFNLCVISGAFHYADPDRTLESVHRVLAPGGLLVITDSPVYSTHQAGRAMQAERSAQLQTLLDNTPPPDLPGGQNYLVASDLLAHLRRHNFTPRLIPIDHPIGRLKRRLQTLTNPTQREHASFPVIVGVKRET